MFRCHMCCITNSQQKQENEGFESALSYKVGIEEEFHLLRTRMDSGHILVHRWDSWRNFYSCVVCEDGESTTWLAQLINDISLPFQMSLVTGYHLCRRGHLLDCLLICPSVQDELLDGFSNKNAHITGWLNTTHPATAISVKQTLKPFCHLKRYVHSSQFNAPG